jgi:hypothetical protein
MLRVCITIIAYIISYLSHSGELPQAMDQDGIKGESQQVEQILVQDTLKPRRENKPEVRG